MRGVIGIVVGVVHAGGELLICVRSGHGRTECNVSEMRGNVGFVSVGGLTHLFLRIGGYS